MLWIDDEWTEERTSQAQLALINQKSTGVAPNEFWIQKYKTSGAKYWHEFYKRNKTNFYKDRHYLQVVFPELDYICDSTSNVAYHSNDTNQILKLMEVGCGVGNAVLPLLELNPRLEIHAIDFAKSAIVLLNTEINSDGNSKYNVISSDDMEIDTEIETETVLNTTINKRITATVCDITKDLLPVEENSMDLILCMFVISAIAPEHMEKAFQKLFCALKPGGKLLFRDYGRYDEAQMRFSNKNRLEDNFYVRQDGTCAYYFEDTQLVSLLCGTNSSGSATGSSGTNSSTCSGITGGSSGGGLGLESVPDAPLETVFNAAMNMETNTNNTNTNMSSTATGVGFKCEECYYIHRQYANRNQKKVRFRVWVHGKFVKPK